MENTLPAKIRQRASILRSCSRILRSAELDAWYPREKTKKKKKDDDDARS